MPYFDEILAAFEAALPPRHDGARAARFDTITEPLLPLSQRYQRFVDIFEDKINYADDSKEKKRKIRMTRADINKDRELKQDHLTLRNRLDAYCKAKEDIYAALKKKTIKVLPGISLSLSLFRCTDFCVSRISLGSLS